MRIGLAAAAVTFALMTGCGSHDSAAAPRLPGPAPGSASAGIDAAFWGNADRFCRPFLEYENRHPSLGPPGMNPDRPTRAQLGALLAQERRTHDPFLQRGVWTRFVQQVGLPRTGGALWRPIAHNLRGYDAAAGAVQRATLARHGAAFGRAYRATNAVLAQLAVDLGAADPPPSNTCEQLFG